MLTKWLVCITVWLIYSNFDLAVGRASPPGNGGAGGDFSRGQGAGAEGVCGKRVLP